MLERGTLQSKEFAAFANRVVLYLHVTSKTADEPEPGLLQRVMGHQSWPSLAFLDGEGATLARQGSRQRSATDFERTRKQIEGRSELAKRAENDAESARRLFELDLLVLDSVTFSKATARLGKLEGFSKERRQALEARLIDMEVRHLANTHQANGRLAVAAALTEMLNAGRIPTNPSVAYTFWSNILFGAENAGDLALYERGVAGFESVFGEDAGMKAIVTGYRKKLAKMRAARGKN